jgi:formate hydrogenlyase transcriptional activator
MSSHETGLTEAQRFAYSLPAPPTPETPPTGVPIPVAPATALEALRHVARGIAATQELPVVLDSIVTTLVERAGAAIARVFLLLDDAECEICRAHGGHAGAMRPDGGRHLHVCASAGLITEVAGPDHVFPAHLPSVPGKVLREGRPYLTNDLLTDVGEEITPEQRVGLTRMGIRAAGAIPLVFRGEQLGVIGMLSREPFDPRAWELQSIFADQAAMAIKSAQLFGELARYEARLELENAYLAEEMRTERGFEQLVGNGPALRTVIRHVKQVAGVDTTVLLTGETGTGKEVVARAIHALSPRSDRPLIKLNCGAIPQGIVESELFGHERGAFTGALQRRLGRFELADKGTLFLDEVGELPLDVQIKLLRVLQEGELERVGGGRPVRVDVRLIAATNRDLEAEVAAGRFRSDLYYRLAVFPILMPPLRERPEDVPALVRHFLRLFQRKLGTPVRMLAPEALARLQAYAWPGNIRELQNVIERACVLATGAVLDVADVLPGSAGAPEGEPADDEPLATLEESERLHVRRALAATNGRIHGPDGAAALLGINGSTLRSRMQKLGIAKHVS